MGWGYQYQSETEREKLIGENKLLFLIRRENLTEGKFLTFWDKPLPAPAVYVNMTKEEFEL
ncbi:hypothetical protein D3C74_462970 [compost metagenome]